MIFNLIYRLVIHVVQQYFTMCCRYHADQNSPFYCSLPQIFGMKENPDQQIIKKKIMALFF